MGPATPTTDPMTEIALRSLRDIAVPPPVSWMPQTWGWAVLATILVVVLLVVFLRWLKAYRANAYRREALAQLAEIEEKIRDPVARGDGLRELAALLKRVMLAGWGRPAVAEIAGAAWVRFLSEHGDEKASTALERLLDDLEYHGNAEPPPDVVDQAVPAARSWIGHHHVSA
ncbi:DUF4381 domain-containing protein [Rhizobium sp. CNPSo 3464]|uniref:DUF4381 domain-containing protein n=1 Tax=Rhizobium sp. CNPSo 3464 TaxID=3021406 RepID=UPI00254A6876|nr:DUF4381 domain-containing protein [Rhizobium sp. CNPSo 3464]MDK4742520.1 DUF4381 domain-containing protein [Rhizobium sp. CNPSo 3464]